MASVTATVVAAVEMAEVTHLHSTVAVAWTYVEFYLSAHQCGGIKHFGRTLFTK
jgi:hypothetical protein